jgi:hypothetical protein
MAREFDNDVGTAGTRGTAAEALGHDPELEELQRRHRGFVFRPPSSRWSSTWS